MNDHIRTRTFNPSLLYIHDDGRVFCGAHVGTEATYYPQQWDTVGAAPVVEIEGMRLVCEASQCTPVLRGGA